jgi:hypothetical protein
MSSNLDLARSIFAATERTELLQPAEWAQPEIEWIIAGRPTAGGWTGVAGMAESLGNPLSARDEVRIFGDESPSWMTSVSSHRPRGWARRAAWT